MQKRLFYHGAFDNSDLRELTTRLGKDAVFFDVGSYFGYYSLVVSKQTDGGAKVFAFEPVSSNYKLLVENLDLNRFDNIRAFQLAISDAAGEVNFEIPSAANRGVGHIALGGIARDGMETVKATTLDRFVEEQGIRRLDAMKIDVEGAELRVFAGAHETLARFKPAMVVELNPPCLKRFGASADDLLQLIRELGYDIYRAKSSGIKKFAGLEAGESYANIFCLPHGAKPEVRNPKPETNL